LQQSQLAAPAADGLVGYPDRQQQDDQHRGDGQHELVAHQGGGEQCAQRCDRIGVQISRNEKAKDEPKDQCAANEKSEAHGGRRPAAAQENRGHDNDEDPQNELDQNQRV